MDLHQDRIGYSDTAVSKVPRIISSIQATEAKVVIIIGLIFKDFSYFIKNLF